MVYRKIFTTGLDSRTHTHTHTHTYVHTTFHKGTRTGFLTFFCLSLSHAHAHTHTHTKKHGRWWCSGCFGPWRRRHSNHSALTSSSGVQEERQTDTHCLCLFHFKLYYGNQFFLFFFKRNTLRLAAHTHTHTLRGCRSGRRKLYRDVFCMSQTKSWNIFRLSDRRYKHTHAADGVISQSTCAKRVSPCLNIRLNPLPLDGKSKPATRRWFYSNPEVDQHRLWPLIRFINHFTKFMLRWHE